MLVIAGLLIGAIGGGLTAKRRNGTGFDIAQYAGVFALIGGILGMFATVIIERML